MMIDEVQKKISLSVKAKEAQILIRVSTELREFVKAEGKASGVTSGALVRAILETYMEASQQKVMPTPPNLRNKILGVPYHN